MDYLDRISRLEQDFEKLASNYEENKDDYKRNDEWREGFLGAMRGIIMVVEAAQKSGYPHLDEVLERSEATLNCFMTSAYSCSRNSDPLFESLDAFCDSEERPVLKMAQRKEGRFSHKIAKMGLDLMRILQSHGQLKNDAPLPQGPAPWKNTPHPHVLSTRCARFVDDLPGTCPPFSKPLAESVFQARAEVTMMDINQPSRMIASSSAQCVMTLTAGGYKNRSPYISVLVNDDEQPADQIDGMTLCVGLEDLAYHGAVDDESKLLFVGDSSRIKSYSWWNTTENLAEDELVPMHTLDSDGFRGAIGVLPNRRVIRAGTGKIGVWNLDGLPTHYPVDGSKESNSKGTEPKIIGGSLADSDGELDSWRDDPEEIELSCGSALSSTIKLADENLKINHLHAHPTATGSMLISTADPDKNNQYYCRVLDFEAGARCSARFLGHGGEINEFSTSRGDLNVFITASNDGHARLYDVRQPLPQLTIRSGEDAMNCSAAVLCHPDGIPYVFLSEEEGECVTLWDVRAQAPLYELATGNNAVTGLVWNDSRNELYASTVCEYIDRLGENYDYERAKLPRERRQRDEEGEDMEEDWESDEDDEWDEDTDQAWPTNAYHGETEFGHIFDSGDHRIYRYAFKSNPNPDIVPPDGGVTPSNDDMWWD